MLLFRLKRICKLFAARVSQSPAADQKQNKLKYIKREIIG